jgi:hypothetical protein
MSKLQGAPRRFSFRLGFLLFLLTPSDIISMMTVGAYVARHGSPWWHTLPGGRAAREETDSGGFRWLLSLGGARRGEQAAGERAEERSPADHWMISSARPSSDGGIVKPKALAVLRLMTSSVR